MRRNFCLEVCYFIVAIWETNCAAKIMTWSIELKYSCVHYSGYYEELVGCSIQY